MNKKIITSLYAYNYNLFIAYFNKTLKIQNIPQLRTPFFASRSNYESIINVDDFIVDMQAKGNILYASTPNKLISYDLLNQSDNSNNEVFSKNVPDCSLLKIDYKENILFLVSNQKGIIALNIKNPKKPKFISNFIPTPLSNFSDLSISDIDVYNKKIFLTIRKFGITRIDYEGGGHNFEILKEIDKIKLIDPQVTKYSEKFKRLYIGDADKGFIVYDINRNKIVFNEKLPNNDFPQDIIKYYSNIVIRGKKGLYYFKNNQKRIFSIFNKKIGAITSYYNQIFFVEKGDSKILVLGKLSDGSMGILGRSPYDFQTWDYEL